MNPLVEIGQIILSGTVSEASSVGLKGGRSGGETRAVAFKVLAISYLGCDKRSFLAFVIALLIFCLMYLSYT
jgi:hypothetical protein